MATDKAQRTTHVLEKLLRAWVEDRTDAECDSMVQWLDCIVSGDNNRRTYTFDLTPIEYITMDRFIRGWQTAAKS